MNGPTFLAYVEQIFVPTLRRGNIVIMDHLSSHKVPGVKEAIESAGATVKYLPKYSPDLNPIELFFGKLKALLRKAAADRTVPSLWRKIAKFPKTITPRECTNYFRHAGYAST